MRYRTRLFLSFNALVALSALVALIITYEGSSKLIFNQIRSQLLSVVTNSAASINGDLIEQFKTEYDTQKPSYQDLIHQLRIIRNTNRTPHFYLKFVYIVQYQPKDNLFTFIADAEENPEERSYYGEIMPDLPGLLSHVDSPYVVEKPYRDPWGTWFSAFAPIYDSNNQVAGTLGIDINAHFIYQEMQKLLLYGLVALAGALFISLLVAHYLSKRVTSSLASLCSTLEKIGQGDLSARIYLNTKDEFDHLASTLNSMTQGLEERDRLKAGFSRYVSRHVLDTILSSDKATKLEGEKRKVTILFSDIRHFTSIAERFSPEAVVSLLNEYFEQMISIIFAHQGMLDKFIGDGLMAEFGAPLEDKEQELHAIRAAVHMQQMVSSLSQKWEKQGYPQIRIGIGIHSGFAIVGNIGSNVRMEYTAIGDSVNVASRLEHATKTLQQSIIVSKETHDALKECQEFSFKDLGELQLPGRAASIQAYAVIFEEKRNYHFPEDFPSKGPR